MDLRMEPGAVRLPWAVVRVGGPEAFDYLQGQLSQDLAGLTVNGSTWSLLLEPTGKPTAWLRVTRTLDDELVLDAPAPSAEPIVTRLERFKLRTKADIEALRWQGVAVRGPGSAAVGGGELSLPCGWPGVEGVDLLGPAVEMPAGVAQVDPADLEALRIEAGVPALGAELTPDTIPAEAGAWLIDASVSFTKGCFTGQELVARIESRGGNVPRPIRGLVVTGHDVPPPGAEVAREGTAVGVVTSSARSEELGPIALAPLKRSVDPGAEVDVRWAEHAHLARVEKLPLR